MTENNDYNPNGNENNSTPFPVNPISGESTPPPPPPTTPDYSQGYGYGQPYQAAAPGPNPNDPPQIGAYYSNQAGYSVSGPKNDSFAVTAISTGIPAIPLMCCCGILSIPLSIVAIVFGALSLQRIGKSNGQLSGKGLAITGLTCGIIAAALSIVAFIFSLVTGGFDPALYQG